MRTRSILLVEDNPDDVELTRLAFEQSGLRHPVTVAGDGAEALDYLFCEGRWAARDPGDPPVLVLLDLKLPRVDGLEVLRRMRQDARTRLLPVVVLTSSDEEQDLVESYALGANSYVRKPVDFTAFHEAARQLSLYWLVLNEAPPVHRGGAGGVREGRR
jgi:two-component system response regulator